MREPDRDDGQGVDLRLRLHALAEHGALRPGHVQITNTGAIQHNIDFQIPYNGAVGWSGGLGLLGGESQSETLNYSQTGPYMYQCDLHWIQGQMIGTLTVTQSG